MCIAIVKLEGIEISKDRLKTCFDHNPDGCGFAYVNEGVIKTHHFLSFDGFYKQYKKAQANFPESKFLIHFRIGTQGSVRLGNCHPFIIDDNHVFIHNGVITGMPTGEDRSDTCFFNELIMQKLPTGWEHNSAIQSLLENRIGYSKICMLNSDNEVLILNENKGVWDEDGNWYSNHTYKPAEAKKIDYTRGNNNYYKFRADEWMVGTQRRRYANPHNQSDWTIEAFDTVQSKWREITYDGKFVDEKPKSGATDWEEMEICEMCSKWHPMDKLSPFTYMKHKQRIERRELDRDIDVFHVCDGCADSIADYVMAGCVFPVNVYDAPSRRGFY